VKPIALAATLASAWIAMAAFAPAALATLPEEGDCPAITGVPSDDGVSIDAVPFVLKEGMVLHHEDLLILRQLLPSEIWRHREVFLFEGMSMEIGPCYRRYPVPASFRHATERFAGEPQLDDDNNLKNYTAGLPFPPEGIDPELEDAAAKWAWNLERRYRGAGFRGSFRLVDFPSRLGNIQRYRGSVFQLQSEGRSDLPEQDYQIPEADGMLWAAGGEFTHPFDARHLAWRQFRPNSSLKRYRNSDDTFVYIPTMRKMRRAATSWVDGMFMPSYSFGGDGGGGPVPFGTGGGTGGLDSIGSINPTSGQSIPQSMHINRGVTGLSIRPNAYVWRMRGYDDLLAPINASRRGYPKDMQRNFGNSGLSVASDRWEIRRTVVIEGALRVADEVLRTVTIHVDYQTQQPLYWMTRTDKRRLLEIGIFVHRFSGDVAGYPRWPGGTQALVFDPVAQVFYNALEGAGGWRRESYDMLSVPYEDKIRRSMTTSEPLQRGR
jgi:hypothetical protein